MSKQESNEHEQIQSLHRSLRFVEQICLLLKLARPCTKTAMDYFYKFSQSQTHQFQIEIMIAAAIFLSAKIFETERKIRDILNMIFAVTALHKIIQREQTEMEEEGKILKVREFIQFGGISEAIQPSYSVSNYNEYKSKIFEAEQHLLRILGFDFAQSQKNLTELKTITVLIHQLRLPQLTAQAILNTYNDLPFTQLEKWIAGIFYFGYTVGKVAYSQRQVKEEIIVKDEEWESLFCTSIDKLRNYSMKIANYYEKNVNAKEREKMEQYQKQGKKEVSREEFMQKQEKLQRENEAEEKPQLQAEEQPQLQAEEQPQLQAINQVQPNSM